MKSNFCYGFPPLAIYWVRVALWWQTGTETETGFLISYWHFSPNEIHQRLEKLLSWWWLHYSSLTSCSNRCSLLLREGSGLQCEDVPHRLTHRVIQIQVRVELGDQMVALVQFTDFSGKPVNCGERERKKRKKKLAVEVKMEHPLLRRGCEVEEDTSECTYTIKSTRHSSAFWAADPHPQCSCAGVWSNAIICISRLPCPALSRVFYNKRKQED